MKKLMLLVLVCSSIFISCGEDEYSNVILNFKAVYNGTSFLMFDDLEYGDASIQITDSDFFISNIVLTNDSGDEVKLDNVGFIDFTNTNIITDPDSKDRGINFKLENIPAGIYTKIKFGVGLNPEQNTSVPADYSSDNVLSKTTHYWSSWDSYIFMKLQGLYTDSDNEDVGFVFHIGNDDLYREVELDIAINLAENDEQVVNIELEHQSLFDDNGSLFDILSSPSNHQPELGSPMFMVVNNFQSAFISQ